MYQDLQDVWAELIAEDGEFAITEVAVGGNMIKTYAAAPPSLREIWQLSEQFAERDYLVYRDERLTYAAAHTQVASIACWLRDQGVGSGDRVAIAMRNYPEWMLAYWATISIGATAVGMNAWWTEPEVAYGLGDSGPKVVICDNERLQLV